MIFNFSDSHIVLFVKITPNASERGIRGVMTSAEGVDFLRISIISIPEKGKANKELIKFLIKYTKERY